MRVEIKGFDLTKNVRGKLKIFEFPSMPVEVNIQVDIPDKKWDPLLQQKLQEAGKKKLDEIQKLFTEEMTKIDNRVAAAAAKDPRGVNVADEQHTADTVSKQIADVLPGQVKDACDRVYADIQKSHKELLKYQLKCAAKIIWASVKLTVAAARIGVSHGADVSAYISAAKDIYAIGTVVYELAKSSDTLQKEVGTEYQNLANAVAKLKQETKNIKIVARQLADVEPKCKKVEAKLGVFRPKITGVDEKSHSLAASVDKLLNAAEKARGDLNPKALDKQKVMEQKIDLLINKIETLQVKVQEQRKYADAIELTVKQYRADYTKGVATTVKVVDFLTKAKEVYDAVKEVVDVVKDIVDLVT